MTIFKKWNGTLFLFGISLAVGILGLTSCSSSKSPSSPAGPAAASTPTPTATAIPGIYWQSASVYGFNGIGDYANLNITVNGQALTNVSAIVTGPSVTTPVTLAYSATTVIGGVTYANYFSSSANINYTPGDLYTLTTVSGAATAACTLSGPGNIAVATN